MPSKTRSRGAHAAQPGWAARRGVIALVVAAVLLATGGTVSLVLLSGPTNDHGTPLTSVSSTGARPPDPSGPTTSGFPTVTTTPVTPSSTPTTSSTASPSGTPSTRPSSAPAPKAVTIKSLVATGRSGQAKATVAYQASEVRSPRIECRVGSVTGPTCQGSPWPVGSAAGRKALKIGGLPDGARTVLYFFQTSGGAAGPTASGHVVPYGPIGTVKFTQTSSSGLELSFSVKVQPQGKPVHVTVTDTAGHRWTAKTGRTSWTGSSSFSEPTWNTTYELTLTVTDTPGSDRSSATATRSRTIRWLADYTIQDPAHPGTCATSTTDATWYSKSGCPGTWIGDGSTVQVTCAISGPAYYRDGKRHGPNTPQWSWYFMLFDGTFIHTSATQEAAADGADGNPLC